MPPVANVKTSNAVKSGLRNTSTSKSLPHGRDLMSSGASLTNVSYFALSALSTIAVKPAVAMNQDGIAVSLSVVDTCTFPLCTATVWVDVRLNKADVAFDDRANVLHPVLRALLVRIDGTRLEAAAPGESVSRKIPNMCTDIADLRLDVVLEHRDLVLVGSVFLRLSGANV